MQSPSTLSCIALDSKQVLLSIERTSSLGRGRVATSRLLINSTEGTQRRLTCERLSSTKLNWVINTRVDLALGLPGLYFCMADGGAGTLRLRGPTGMTQLVRAFVHAFVRRTYPVLDVVDVAPKRARFESKDGFDVLAVALGKDALALKSFCFACSRERAVSSSSSEEADGDESRDDDSSSDESVPRVESAPKPNMVPVVPPLNGNDPDCEPTLCYIVNASTNLEESIAVIDCARGNEFFLEGNSHLAFTCEKHMPKLIVHISCREVIESREYQTWVLSLKTAARHVYLHSFQWENQKSNQFVTELAKLAPSFYRPMVHRRNEVLCVPPLCESERNSVAAGMAFTMFGPSPERTSSSTTSDFMSTSTNDAAEKIDENEINLNEDDLQLKSPRLDLFPALVFLGTGAAKPSSLRGLSCIQIWFDSRHSALLDAGEDCVQQIAKYLASSQRVGFTTNRREQGLLVDLNGALRTIDFVWISHHHLDHHGGLARVVQMRARMGLRTQVIGPASVGVFLSKTFAPTCFEFHPNPDAPRVSRFIAGTCRVDHCFDAHALALDVPTSISSSSSNTVRILYSGDTRPCANRLMGFRHENLILIHEATFEDSMTEKAKKKKHSTTTEALSVAKDLGAEFVVLTHASQRYAKHMPALSGEFFDRGSSVFAHDFFALDVKSCFSAEARRDISRLAQYRGNAEEHTED